MVVITSKKSALVVLVPRVTRLGKSLPPSEVPVIIVYVPRAGPADENVGNYDSTLIPLIKASSTTNSIVSYHLYVCSSSMIAHSESITISR